MPLWWEKRDAPLLLARWKWRSLGSPLSSFDPHRGVVPHYLLVEVGVQVPTRPFAGNLLTAGGGGSLLPGGDESLLSPSAFYDSTWQRGW